MSALHALALAAALAAPPAARAVTPGDRLEDALLPALAGGEAHLLPAGARVHVLVFVKTGHPHCLEALQGFAGHEADAAGAHWVAILPGDTPLDEARALAAAAGTKIPFVIDVGDRLYGKLAVKLHPTTVIVDRDGRVASYEPYRRIQYTERVTALVRFALGEITEAQLAAADDPARVEERTDAGVARRHEKYAANLLGLGQLEQALAEVGKGLAMTPTATGYGLQASILKKLGRCEEATRAVEAATRLGAGDVLAAHEPCPPHRGAAQ